MRYILNNIFFIIFCFPWNNNYISLLSFSMFLSLTRPQTARSIRLSVYSNTFTYIRHYFTDQETNLLSVLEGDTISVFQGYLLYKYTWKIVWNRSWCMTYRNVRDPWRNVSQWCLSLSILFQWSDCLFMLVTHSFPYRGILVCFKTLPN